MARGLILVEGAVPGVKGGWITVRDAVKKALPNGVPKPGKFKLADAAPAAEASAPAPQAEAPTPQAPQAPAPQAAASKETKPAPKPTAPKADAPKPAAKKPKKGE